MSEIPEYKFDRIFDSPPEMVWRAWTDPEILHRWYGPNIETIIHEFDLKPGGSWLNEMKWGENSDCSKMVFQEVDPPSLLIWHHSSTDSDWNIITSPMMADWPRVLLTTVVFVDMGDKTKVSLSQVPLDGTDAEIVRFGETMSGMDKGWSAGYALIDELLIEVQAEPA